MFCAHAEVARVVTCHVDLKKCGNRLSCTVIESDNMVFLGLFHNEADIPASLESIL